MDRSASPAKQPANGQAGSRIVHFDATARRKEKMRQRATAVPKTASPKTPQSEATAVAPTAAPPVAQSQTTNAVEPAAAKRNGAFAHPAAASPAALPATTPSSNGSANGNGAAAMPTGPELEKFLVEFVVEQTGYPEEMVELDADLEADLGIDSIKKAQLFGELAERFHVNVQGTDELSLDDFATLRHVKSFLESAGSNTAAETPPAPETTPVAATPSPVAAAPAQTAAAPAAIEPVSDEVTSTATSVPQGAELERFLIGFVVEQTGYPEEMVELDADLEADLGIDSIKKAQLFGELAEQFTIDMQSGDDLSLDDFLTLRHVMEFLQGNSQAAPQSLAETPADSMQTTPSPSLSPAIPSVSQPSTPSAGAAMNDAELEEFLVNFVVEQTGYPPEMVEMDADLESDLGIDSIKKAQLFGELAEQFEVNVQSAEDLSLDDFTTLRHVMKFLEGAPQRVTA
jgi:acyl carrier protein